ncbi:MAG: phosphatase PAP2 family protein [Clostridiales bacterium]|nr:phosphatase PAP2 family protein [Clostridiales bacterium]
MTGDNSLRFGRMAGRISVCMAAFFAVTFVIGTFFDHPIASAVFSGGNIPALAISSLGIYVFCGAYSFYLGAALSQAMKVANEKRRILYSTFVIFLAVVIMLVSGGSLLDINNLGGIFPEVHRTIPLMTIVFLFVFLPLAVLGFILGRRNNDPTLGRRIILILNTMTIMLIIYEVIKTGMPRPRFRLIQEHIEGVDFHAWYDPIKNKDELIETFGIYSDNFKSFPSGHTANAVASIAILPGLAAVVPALRKRLTTLFAIGFVFGFIVLASRMVLGAHFLSDVSCGGFIASVASAVYYKRERQLFG